MSEQIGVATPQPGRRRNRKWMLAVAAVVVAAIVGVAVYSEATAPNPFLPSRSMMIGTWHSPSGAVITVRSNGTFTARGLPANAGETSTLDIPAEGEGTWRISPAGRAGTPPGITFQFSPQVFMELLVERYTSAVIMYYDKGDPDEGVTGQYQFTKT